MKLNEILRSDPNLHIDRYGNVTIGNAHLINNELPIELKGIKVNGSFECEAYSLKSLKNAPLRVLGLVEVSKCKDLKSLTGIGKDYLIEIKGIFTLPPAIETCALGIMKIKSISILSRWAIPGNSKWDMAASIIKRHYENDKDIMDCREELVAQGLKEYAKL